MTDEELLTMGRQLTKGARGALFSLTQDWQYASFKTFTYLGAWSLHVAKIGAGRGFLAESEVQNGRRAFRLTAMGKRLRNVMQAHKL